MSNVSKLLFVRCGFALGLCLGAQGCTFAIPLCCWKIYPVNMVWNDFPVFCDNYCLILV